MNAYDEYNELKSKFDRKDREFQRVKGQREQIIKTMKGLGFNKEEELRTWLKESAIEVRKIQENNSIIGKEVRELLSDVERKLG